MVGISISAKCFCDICRKLTPSLVLRLREKYYEMSQTDQTEFLVNSLREDFISSSNEVRYSITVDSGDKVFLCQQAWRRVYGISNDKVQACKKLMLEGGSRVQHGNVGVK